MTMTPEQELAAAKGQLKRLKAAQIGTSETSLWVIHRPPLRKGKAKYIVRRVNIDDKIQGKLRGILTRHIKNSNEILPYAYESADQDEQVLIHRIEGTDFSEIMIQVLSGMDAPAITDLKEMSGAFATLIVSYVSQDDPVVAFRKVFDGWNLRKLGGFYNAIWEEDRLVDFEDQTVLKLDQQIDFIGFQDRLFILSKKSFETGLNFRNGMEGKRDTLLKNMETTQLFSNVEVLGEICGSNMHFLRKFCQIEEVGYYKDPDYMKRLEQVASKHGWKELVFVNGQLILSPENVSHVLSVLSDRRMQSMVKEEIFDVDGNVRKLSGTD